MIMHTPKCVFLFHHSMFRFPCLFKSVSLFDYIMMKKYKVQKSSGIR